MDTSVFGVLKNLINIHTTSQGQGCSLSMDAAYTRMFQ